MSQVISETVDYKGKWLSYKKIVYRGPDGVDRVRRMLYYVNTRRYGRHTKGLAMQQRVEMWMVWMISVVH